jgi:ABC-type multidrug transport system ATPase subunit
MNTILVENTWYRYPGTKSYVLESFSLKKDNAGTIGLLGINGCGKSTLLKLLGGILSPSKGKITLNRISIAENRKKNKIIYIPENARLFLIGPTPHIDLNRIMKDSKQVDELFERYQLKTLANKKIYNLSEGQRRIIAIFIAFQIPSSILLLDEPTIGLDVRGRELLFHLLEQAKKQGKIVFIATNDSRTFARMDELIVIRDGILFQRGSPKEILFNLEESTELIPNQIPRLINTLELQLGRNLPHCLTSKELNSTIKEGRFI